MTKMCSSTQYQLTGPLLVTGQVKPIGKSIQMLANR